MHTHLVQCGAAEFSSRELRRCGRASNVGRLGCSSGPQKINDHHVDTGSAQRAGIDGTLVVVRAGGRNRVKYSVLPMRTEYYTRVQSYMCPEESWTSSTNRRFSCFSRASSALPTFRLYPGPMDASMRASAARCSSKILAHKWTQTAHD